MQMLAERYEPAIRCGGVRPVEHGIALLHRIFQARRRRFVCRRLPNTDNVAHPLQFP
jgi:hypothetical protein